MTDIPQNTSKDELAGLKAAVEDARAHSDKRGEARALAHYGEGLFRSRKFQLGVKSFDKAVALATRLDDLLLQIEALTLKMASYEDVERLPDAYETATVILRLVEARGDTRLTCDALLSQAQILINSGDPVTAFEPLKRAFDLAKAMGDDPRLMKIYGALGSHQLAVAALDKALAYFQSAEALANRLGDVGPVLGYGLNVATVLVWQHHYEPASRRLDATLSLACAVGDKKTELTCRRYLVKCALKLDDPERVRANAEPGLMLALEFHDDAAAFVFYEALVKACFRLGQDAEARAALQAAVDHAGAIGDSGHQIELWLHLGEACVAAGLYDEARAAYEPALVGVKMQGRLKDEAYIIGRLGVTYAELGNVSEAIAYHRQATALARERDLPELEGEQLCLLAMALSDDGQTEEALDCCRKAVACFSHCARVEQAQAARSLLHQLSVLTPV